ncbi:hypothetical protein CHGG_08647 [Chaetomium globosum CBS 148.51]|uniref:Uncharacterized protein n=1 Tax=Chaetomium globosum (strain ATCC 6205 / CBS 148.51 / DSM 1962 / NBRC 6347 / NRRL 1970) TaxID=306901 RepID=Q2GTQ7_CHAGB|nr:uncharacterized protein CHGG_08647 [Chaetomium globosum CBS 148.51]EAQ84633.1 hypothetical protein CHGG_08647 [Chaetomium globosum CBS 148.51]
MPEELEKATGGYYTPPATGGLVERVLGFGNNRSGGELFGQTSDFAAFLDVLKARCDFWHMEGTKDWRRRESRMAPPTESGGVATGAYPQVETAGSGASLAQQKSENGGEVPVMYFLPSDGEEIWTSGLRYATRSGESCSETQDLSWKPTSLVVYGRKLDIPRQYDGVSCWDFTELVTSLGPADYVTLASNFHTFIIDRVPVLTVSMKNEARRFITLLDALYESRCKLVIRAETNPDQLFFPETKTQSAGTDAAQDAPAQYEGAEATYAETIAEVYQDQLSPFRPNISTYSESPNSKYDPDQDSDFGKEQDRKVDFNRTAAFTGEDERFAYKRATSRLWELCSMQWHTRTGDWWQPLPKEARHWEGRAMSKPPPSPLSKRAPSEITMGETVELEEPAGLERLRIAKLRASEQ